MTLVDLKSLVDERLTRELDSALSELRFADAERLALQLLSDREKRHSLVHPEVANALVDLAEALRSQNKLVAAAEALVRALDIDTAVFGDKHERVGEGLHRLAHIQLLASNFEDAQTLFERSVETLTLAAGDADARVGQALLGLAATRMRRGDREAAVQALESALQCFALAHGPEAQTMVEPLEALASVREGSGDFDDAMALRRRAVKILERLDHPHLAAALAALTRCAIGAGDFALAEAAATRALDAHAAVDTERAQVHELLGEVREATGRPLEAREDYRYALAIYQDALPAGHPQLGVALMNVATMDLQLGEVDRADKQARRALEIFLDRFGPEHPHTQGMKEALKRAYEHAGHGDRASELDSLGTRQ
jgi:tetratricopeptide (TPR) repeat protein